MCDKELAGKDSVHIFFFLNYCKDVLSIKCLLFMCLNSIADGAWRVNFSFSQKCRHVLGLALADLKCFWNDLDLKGC